MRILHFRVNQRKSHSEVRFFPTSELRGPSCSQLPASSSPHLKAHLRGRLILIFPRRIRGVSASFEIYMQNLAFTRIWCSHELPVNLSPFDLEVLGGFTRIFNDERSLSRLELRRHIDAIVGHSHVHAACVGVGGQRVLHSIGGLRRAVSNGLSRLFCPPHGRIHNVPGGINLCDSSRRGDNCNYYD